MVHIEIAKTNGKGYFLSGVLGVTEVLSVICNNPRHYEFILN